MNWHEKLFDTLNSIDREIDLLGALAEIEIALRHRTIFDKILDMSGQNQL